MVGKQRLLLLVIAILPLATAEADCDAVVQLSPDTYMAICDSKAGIFASMSKIKSETIALANEYAIKQGKVAVAIATKETRAVPFTFRWPSVEYQFRLVAPGDPSAKSTALSQGRDGLSESIDASAASPGEPAAAPALEHPPERNDIYTQLIDLEELRTKGIITQGEFEEQKRKILAGK